MTLSQLELSAPTLLSGDSITVSVKLFSNAGEVLDYDPARSVPTLNLGSSGTSGAVVGTMSYNSSTNRYEATLSGTAPGSPRQISASLGSEGVLVSTKQFTVLNSPIVASIARSSGQAASVFSAPVSWDFVFSRAIDPASFTASDLANAGSISGVSWSISDQGDHRHFQVQALSFSGVGSVQPLLNVGAVLDSLNNFNSAATDPTAEVDYLAALVGDPASFVTRWDTTQPGTSDSSSIALPLVSGLPYNFFVDWGDGTWEQVNSSSIASVTHHYAASGTYDVSLRGVFPRIYFNGAGDRNKILQVKNWGTNAWTSMDSAFYGCSNLQISATDVPDLSAVTSLRYMFAQASQLNSDLSGWHTDNVTDMSGMFGGAAAFNQNIGNWNTSRVTDMTEMFYNAQAFNQNIGSWDTSHVTHMNYMFNFASVFNQNIGGWNTANVTDMSGMFAYDLAFNQNIGGWNTANVTGMAYMFASDSVFNQNIGGWDTSKVTDMRYMFFGDTAFNQNISAWNTSLVTDMSYMFYGAAVFNQNIGGWNTSQNTNLTNTFFGAAAFNEPIGNWNTSRVTLMSGTFAGASSFNQDIHSWDTSHVTNMNNIFYNATAFNQPIGNWVTSAVTQMNSAFARASSFNQDLSGWDTSHVTKMNKMFSLATAFNQNISSWNTALVTDMTSMFESAQSFNQDLSGWNVSAVVYHSNFDLSATAWILPRPPGF